MKIMVIGPSPVRSKGGMSTVIQGIRDDSDLKQKYQITIFDSYIDGNKLKRAFYTTAAFLRFVRVFEGYDLYHIHVASYGSTFRKARYIRWLKAHGKKVILHIHGAAYMEFYAKLSPKRQHYVVDVLKSCDQVIALSEEWKQRFESVFRLTNCISIPNGIDTRAFAAIQKERAENLPPAFLLLGRLGKRKGAYDLIAAMEQLSQKIPNALLYMAGDGEIEEVRSLIQEKHLEKQIQVVGWVDFQGKTELMKKTSIIVLPSYNEGLPMTILEGMAAGMAIISSTVGAIPEVIREENGFLITPGDITALTDAMLQCAEHPEMVKTMGAANKEKAENSYSQASMHRALAECYDRIGKY